MSNFSDKLDRIGGIVWKEFRQTFRDWRMKRVIFVAPVIQLLLFGYAVSTDVWRTATFVVDFDHTAASRAAVEALTASGYFRVVGRSDRPADLVSALDHGDAILGVEIPAGYAAGLRGGSGAPVQLILDGTRSNTASVAQGYAERILLEHAVAVAPMAVAPPLELRERAWFNPDLASRNYNVPAVVGTLMLLVCLLLTSLAIVREREIGTLEQLRVSPLTPGELIMGKTIPFVIIGLIDLTIVTTVAMLWFNVTFRGSFILLFGASLLYILSALGLGLLISTVSRTQQEAFLTTFLFIMPATLLSGFMFPVSSMPAAFQWVTLLNPVRHYIEIVRAVFLKGAGVTALWPQLLALALIGTFLLSLATNRFRRAT